LERLGLTLVPNRHSPWHFISFQKYSPPHKSAVADLLAALKPIDADLLSSLTRTMPASSSSAAFARAVSPAIDALVHTAWALAPPSEEADSATAGSVERSARHLRIMAAETLEDVILCVPPTFRAALSEPLRGISQETQRCINARATLAKWRTHEASGTIPTHLRSSAPQVQQSAGYKDAAEAKAFQAKLRDAHLAYLKAQLTTSIAAKADEVKSLEAVLTPEKLFERLRPLITTRADVLVETQKIPVFRELRRGEPTLSGFEENPVVKRLCDQVLHDVVVYALRVVALVHSQDALSKSRLDKKRSLSEATVAAAGDGDNATMLNAAAGPSLANSSIQSLVDKAVKAAVRQVTQRGGPRGRGGRGGTRGAAPPASHVNASATTQAAGSGGARGGRPARGRGRGGRQAGGLSRVSNELADSFRTIADFFTGAGPGAHCHTPGRTSSVRTQTSHIPQACSTLTADLYRRRQPSAWPSSESEGTEQSSWQGVNTEFTIRRTDTYVEPLNADTCSFDSDKYRCVGDQWILAPFSIPDQLLLMPTPSAIEFILSRTSIGLLSDLKFQQHVHLSPGVNLPQEISFQLSVGMKYMFHRPTNASLIKASWLDFERRLRWRLKFMFKEPVKFRPIIPCHSAIQNPAAKYVSKKLKPLVEGSPTIIHGSKDLAIKLSNLVLIPGAQWYVVTGDVVAFYPNIPLENCLNIINQMYLEHYWGSNPNHDTLSNRLQQKLFYDALQIGNTKLVTQFQGDYFEQLRGLAMGVSDSPDLANLYGVYFENRAKVLEDAAIPFYGRYIDDCLAIVYASSETEAVNLLSEKIHFDGCVIEWGASYLSQPFLDMLLYKDSDNSLQWLPYRKARNNQERIPWISGHPYDVKRGTFYGEMSRLAVLSSKHSTYVEALRGLVNLYLHRGYPVQEVQKWLRTSAQERWIKKHTARTRDSTCVLVLKSEYNLAWNYFSARELGETVIGYWRTWLNKADLREFSPGFPSPPVATTQETAVGYRLDVSWEDENGNLFGFPDLRKYEPNVLDARFLVSKTRTRNMLDLTNLWKTTVLANLEEQVLEEINEPLSEGLNQLRLDPDVNLQVVGALPLPEVSNEDEHTELHRRQYSPDAPDPWHSGASGTWSRGANPR
jgi:hypothetical protein